MFEWWSQKIGSWAAASGSFIHPPTAPCTVLCGISSSWPGLFENCCTGVGPPPKRVVPLNFARLIAWAERVTDDGSARPALMLELRCDTKSGFATPFTVGWRNRSGIAACWPPPS